MLFGVHSSNHKLRDKIARMLSTSVELGRVIKFSEMESMMKFHDESYTWVVTDVQNTQEAEKIRNLGGKLFKVGVSAKDSVDYSFDAIIINENDAEVKKQISIWLKYFGTDK